MRQLEQDAGAERRETAAVLRTLGEAMKALAIALDEGRIDQEAPRQLVDLAAEVHQLARRLEARGSSS